MAFAKLERVCRSYARGHCVHAIQARLAYSDDEAPRAGNVIRIESGVITVYVEGDLLRYRSHDMLLLRELIDHHGDAILLRTRGVLSVPGAEIEYLVSVAAANVPWDECVPGV